MEIKKKFYILCFTILGLVLGTLAAEITQLVYLKLLISDFSRYSFGMSWDSLGQFYYFFALLLMAVSTLWGFSAGKYWWEQIYVKRKFDKRWKNMLKN